MGSPSNLLADEIELFMFCVPCPKDNIIGHDKTPEGKFLFDRSVPRKPRPSEWGQGAQYEITTLPESPAL